jgi:hypothetical protein
MATYTAMAGLSVGHCKAFVVRAAERAAIQFRVTIYPHIRQRQLRIPNISAALNCGKLDLRR